MSLPKIEERSFYTPLTNYLKEIGFEAIAQTRIDSKETDVLFKIDSETFVIEVKIGDVKNNLKATAQAYDYAKRLGTNNIIILFYPERLRNQTVLKYDIIDKLAIEEEVQALILTDYLIESIKGKPSFIFNKLKNAFISKRISIDFNTIVKLIGGYVTDLNSVVYQIKTENLVSEVVKKLDLFSGIGNIKDKDTAKKQVVNLASYLLFNQLLFYHILKKRTQDKRLKELEEIKKIKDVQKYFDLITEIDYQSIYNVNILAYIPEKPEVIEILNDVIKAVKMLRAEHITQDLSGRFFHDLIPFEVRKVLAAFYTHPIAAEILAGLTIDSCDETVIDPSCGSGTLLVASYKRKQELYEKLYGFKDLGKLHKKFIEEDITGIDIMPFAAHISTINLTTQNIEQETNTVRIATKDSLSLATDLKTIDFSSKKGVKISSYTEQIQKTLFGISGQRMKEGALSPEGKGSEFYLNPFDIVIMNPPFSDREKMPFEMREKLKDNILGNICGNHVNLWGYFLALADSLLKSNGKIGAVIPINIARGKATEKIRNFLIENYHIKYIVKPVGDIAFSEGAAFRDVLLIAEKKKPNKDDITKFIFFKKSIRNLNQEKVKIIIEEIKSKNKNYSSDDFEIYCIDNSELKHNSENLMPLLWVTSAKTIEKIKEFLELLDLSKLEQFKEGLVKEGFHTSPAGITELTFITRAIDESRIKRAFLVLENENKKQIKFKIKYTDLSFKINKNFVKKALRTITGVNSMDITKDSDYFIKDNFREFNKILEIAKWNKKSSFSWKVVKENSEEKFVNLVFARRFNLYSPNTYFLSFYSDEEFISPDTLKIFPKISKDNAKILCLYLNSIINLLQVLMNKEETTGQFGTIRETDLVLFKLINLMKLNKNEKTILLNEFDNLKNVKFPSILEQLENRFWARVELDKTILKILGFSDKEIEEWLPKVYDTIVEELKTMKEVK